MTAMNSQRLLVLAYLKKGNRLTSRQAQSYCGCDRLGARIWELRRQGYDIVTTMIEVEGRYRPARVAEYRLKRGTKCTNH